MIGITAVQAAPAAATTTPTDGVTRLADLLIQQFDRDGDQILQRQNPYGSHQTREGWGEVSRLAIDGQAGPTMHASRRTHYQSISSLADSADRLGNLDGRVTRNELIAGVRVFDRNGDGALSADERKKLDSAGGIGLSNSGADPVNWPTLPDSIEGRAAERRMQERIEHIRRGRPD